MWKIVQWNSGSSEATQVWSVEMLISYFGRHFILIGKVAIFSRFISCTNVVAAWHLNYFFLWLTLTMLALVRHGKHYLPLCDPIDKIMLAFNPLILSARTKWANARRLRWFIRLVNANPFVIQLAVSRKNSFLMLFCHSQISSLPTSDCVLRALNASNVETFPTKKCLPVLCNWKFTAFKCIPSNFDVHIVNFRRILYKMCYWHRHRQTETHRKKQIKMYCVTLLQLRSEKWHETTSHFDVYYGLYCYTCVVHSPFFTFQ